MKAIRKRSAHRTRQLTRTGEEVEFMIKLNGRKIAAILDTGSSIAILPKKNKPEIKPKRDLKRAITRRFADVSARPLHVNNRYKIPTELNGQEQEIIWWETDTDTKPIIGMDSLDKLGLQLVQRRTSSNEQPADVLAIQRHIQKERKTDTQQHRAQSSTSISLSVPQNSEQTTDDNRDKSDDQHASIQKRVSSQFPKLLNTNTTVKNFKYKVQYKKNMEIIQQKGRQVPIHTQKAVETE